MINKKKGDINKPATYFVSWHARTHVNQIHIPYWSVLFQYSQTLWNWGLNLPTMHSPFACHYQISKVEFLMHNVAFFEKSAENEPCFIRFDTAEKCIFIFPCLTMRRQTSKLRFTSFKKDSYYILLLKRIYMSCWWFDAKCSVYTITQHGIKKKRKF